MHSNSLLDYFNLTLAYLILIQISVSPFLVGKSKETVPSPSRSTGPVWIIRTWENCAVAASSSKPSTTASLINWGGRDPSWETCLRWDLWGVDCALAKWAAWLMGSILADCGLCKRLWLHLRKSLIQLRFWAGKSCILCCFGFSFHKNGHF